MRSSTKSWLLFATTSLSVCAINACSADGGGLPADGTDSGASAQDSGGSSDNDASTGNDAGTGNDSSFGNDSGNPVDSSVVDTGHDGGTAVDAGTDTGIADSGIADGGHDAALTDAGDAGLPPVGSPCSTVNATQRQTCGLCGYSERVCLVPDGGSQLVWQPWGFCQAEVAGGCTPGSQTNESCGLCGTRVKQCQNDCAYAVGACTGQPPNACSPGSIDYEVGLSCDAGGRQRTCQSSCTWDNFGACFVPDGGVVGNNFLVVPATVGGKATKTFNMPASPKLPHLYSGTCPTTLSSSATSYSYVAVQNNGAQAVTVSLWSGQASGGPDIDTVMAVYSTNNPPADNDATARAACKAGTYSDDTCSDTSTDPTSCLSNWAGLMSGDSHAFQIPAHSHVWVYTAAYFAADSGDYTLTVLAQSFQ